MTGKELLNDIREYRGGMLDLWATTFRENFDINWMKNAARIYDIVPKGKVDVHATYWNYYYKGFRYSFFHGWASCPTSWLSPYVLGVNVLKPGYREISIETH